MKTSKNFFGMLALTMAFFLFAAPGANAQNNNAMINKARVELSDCASNFNGPAWEISGVVAVVNCVTTPCDLAYQVTIYVCPACNPNNPNSPCLKIACRELGTVDFDAQGMVIGSKTTEFCDNNSN